MSRLLGMAACQLEVLPGEIAKNLENMVRQIELIKYYSPWVKIIVASELIIQGSPDFEALAETIPGPISDFCSRIAKKHNIYFIPGSMYEKKEGRIYNSSPVFDDQGNIIE
ncbi:MAG: carbon-nitrogen hydrolase family protein, partial [Proteobacteria bacterium]|nr:carbon-nitrogen hydrolase family protein [Pseudomonadota bacterium]